MEPALLLEHLFDKKKVQVIRQLLAQSEREWTLQELSRASRVPLATTYRIVRKLVSLTLVEERKIKHLTLYVLSESAATKYLTRILETGQSALDAFVEQIKEIKEVEKVVLHGKQTKEKANVLIIGEGINSSQINKMTAKINEQFHFNLISLVVSSQQYDQMVSMGLYSGTKKNLYERPESF